MLIAIFPNDAYTFDVHTAIALVVYPLSSLTRSCVHFHADEAESGSSMVVLVLFAREIIIEIFLMFLM